jgi:hypothetical protein
MVKPGRRPISAFDAMQVCADVAGEVGGQEIQGHGQTQGVFGGML